MYQKAPVSDRVAKIRARYRTTIPKVDLWRYKLVTEFYMENPDLTGILKRAYNLKNLFENMPTPVFEDELIVGAPGETYRCSMLMAENHVGSILPELDTMSTRSVDPYLIDDETKEYIRNTISFWDKNCIGAKVTRYMPEGYNRFFGNGVLNWREGMMGGAPIGHYCGNFWTVVDKGFGAIRDEAAAKMAELEENGIFGDSAKHYNFYRAVKAVSEGFITYTKHYGDEAARQAELCEDPKRRAELLQMADSLHWIIEHPCRTYQEALQAIFLYQMGHILEAQLHGISLGRVDQYVGKYLDADLAAGRLTEAEAQELTDCFMLKLAEQNKVGPELMAMSAPGYTAGQLITVGGTDRQGLDATNKATYMVLQSSHRLQLHDPPVALRVHAGTPDELWEAGIECTKTVGGVPIFENDEIVVESITKMRGIPIEDARNYCLIGCVEPACCGNDFANSGVNGGEAYTILPSALWLAMNNGVFPSLFPGDEPRQAGIPCGYLYDYQSMDELLAAYKAQMDFFLKWQVSMVNCGEYLNAWERPLPFLSATMTGCMESGLDVMWGGAQYSGSGNSSIGHGTVADSFNIIDQLCFREHYCTTGELYDALMANWEGYEDLRQYILGKAVHFGNNDEEADKYLPFVGDTYADAITRGVTPRNNRWTAGCWPVTLNVMQGKVTPATPDGRKAGDPLSDGISPVQSMDKNGPFATINSILKFDQTKYANGTLCNMKFHPTALQGAEGDRKLRAVMEAFYSGGGMELQINVVSADMLRDAQKHPEEYQDLVVRVAGFSAYFVDVFKESQDDLIHRTEMSV